MMLGSQHQCSKGFDALDRRVCDPSHGLVQNRIRVCCFLDAQPHFRHIETYLVYQILP